MKSMTPAIASMMRITHPSAPCGAGPFLPFGRTSLNLAISAMVASRLMTRLRLAVAVALVLVGCKERRPMPDAFGETIGEWHRTGITEASETSVVKNAERTLTATYRGPGKLEARIYALASPSVALDTVQRWT